MQLLLPSTSGRISPEIPTVSLGSSFRCYHVPRHHASVFTLSNKLSFHRQPEGCSWLGLARCQGNKALEESIQAGLDEQERRDTENKKRAREYKQLNDQLEATAKEVKERLEGTSIYLVGMMGSGKSTVGKLVARALQYPFLDSDHIAESHAETTIAKIFAEEGEEAFRDLESAVLQELMPFRSCIVATGGGAVTRRQNWGYMQHGIVAWLNGPPELLARRTCGDGASSRPLIGASESPDASKEEEIEATRKKLAAMLDKRKDQYAQADLTISLQDHNNPAGASVSVVAYRLLKALNDRLKRDKKYAPGSQPPEFRGFGKQA